MDKETIAFIQHMEKNGHYMDLFSYIAPVIAAGVRAMLAVPEAGCPVGLSETQWVDIQNKIVDAMDIIAADGDIHNDTVTEGCWALGEYFTALWI
jgi:hypothetical protein